VNGYKISTEKYDFVSLYEIMKDRERSAILSALSVPPRGNIYGGELSSLLTISQSFNVTRHAHMSFSRKGKSYRIDPTLILGVLSSAVEFDVSLDSDYYAEKGVLLTEIDTGLKTANNQGVSIEIYSTHLMFGGGLGKATETIANIAAPFGDHIAPSNSQERFAIQIQQVDELVNFYRQNHRPQNVAILCGDFNLDGTNAQQFAVLKSRLSAIGMIDTWADGPIGSLGSGQTSRNDDGAGQPHEADFSKVCFPSSNTNAVDYCDETQVVPSPSEYVGRFDYIFIEAPTVEHLCNVDFARVRRRQFRRQRPTPSQQFLSDHLGLETTFFVSLKT
jgi:endonuclease/exonuclease/phosphatase family metal-dependent hydrolase